jgi:hypothetical protein
MRAHVQILMSQEMSLTDSFQFQNGSKSGAFTRRGMLSYSLFDPLGLISPVTLVGKQLLQEVCKEGVDWDDPLPEEIVEKWRK